MTDVRSNRDRLDSARNKAKEAILDQRAFFLDADGHQKFLDLLDALNPPSGELRARMARKPVWER
ncbi:MULTISPECIES: DUF1778 domain-containing protein [unclassified Mesorhizobium]|uniref:type II toxin-antitoxin system TacA family antitoxin n=1 Tax=unclassified Mesorhizobium TaxID=325217 RepID=UPI0015E47816|nr:MULTISPECIES: DUF1778 domain-containing protein [unclassified Mesorhizobium]